jgi:hypothetical protein
MYNYSNIEKSYNLYQDNWQVGNKNGIQNSKQVKAG